MEQAFLAEACGIGLLDFFATDMWLVFASVRLAFVVELQSAFVPYFKVGSKVS